MDGDDLGVVDESVDHGGGYDSVAEFFALVAERLVEGDDQAGPPRSGGRRVGRTNDLVNDQQG